MKSTQTIQSDLFQTLIVSCFNLLVITVPLFFLLNTEELFEFNKMILTYFLTTGILGLWLARMIYHRRIIFSSTKLDISVLIFLLSQLLSTLFSIHPYTSLLGYYTRFHGGLVSIFCYTILYYAFVSNFEKRFIKGFYISLFATAGLVSLYGILEHFGHSFSCYLATSGQSFGVDCWVQDVKNRVFATFGQPNWLAAYLLMLVPLGITLTTQVRTRLSQVALLALNLVFVITIIFTRSRSGLVALGCELIFFFCCYAFAVWQDKKKKYREIFKTLAPSILSSIAFLIVGLSISNPYSDPIWQRFRSFFHPTSVITTPVATSTVAASPAPVVDRLETGISDSSDIRKVVWKGAIAVWRRYPIFGSGVETFGYSYYQDRPVEHNSLSEWDFLYNKAHNEFLNFLATTGLVGFLSYCGLLAAFFYFGFQKTRSFITAHDLNSASLATALMAGVLGLSISNFFGFSTVMVTILMFLFFGILDLVADPLSELPMKKQSQALNWQYTAWVLVGLLVVSLFYKTYSYWVADMEYTKGKNLLQQGDINQGLPQMLSAIERTPQEALFYDTLATDYATYAVAFAQAGEASTAAELATHAVEAQRLTLQLNPRQLNYYKTGAKMYITLSQLEPKALPEAQKVLESALPLAPTDPKIVYNLALVELGLGQRATGIADLQKTLTLKPDYDIARTQLAKEYEADKKFPQALEQYTYLDEQSHATDPIVKEKIASLSALLKH